MPGATREVRANDNRAAADGDDIYHYPDLVRVHGMRDCVVNFEYVTHAQRTHAASSLVKNTSPQ
jgi:hypothetical protein